MNAATHLQKLNRTLTRVKRVYGTLGNSKLKENHVPLLQLPQQGQKKQRDRKRRRDGESQRETQKEKSRERERQRDRETECERKIKLVRERERDGKRVSGREIE